MVSQQQDMREPVPQSAGLRLLAQRQAGGLYYISVGRGVARGKGVLLAPRQAIRVTAVPLFDLDDLSAQSPDVVQRSRLILVLDDHLQFHNFLGREDDGHFRLGEIQVHRSCPNLTKRVNGIYYTLV